MTTEEALNWKEVFAEAKRNRMSVRVLYDDVTTEIHDIALSHGFKHIEELNKVKFFLPR
jgi:hypothetical protein